MRFIRKKRHMQCSVKIISVVFIAVFAGHISGVLAEEAFYEYDNLWIKRNAAARLTVLERAVNHYATAVRFYEAGDYTAAERFAKDALKVEPRFPEAVLLRALIYEQKGNNEKSLALQEKAASMRDDMFGPVLEECRYLQDNIERLKALYDPPVLYTKIVFFLLLSFGMTIFFAVLVSTNFFMAFAMRMRQVLRIMRSPKDESSTTVIIDRFPGEDPEVKIAWPVYCIAYGLCFAFAFGIVSIFDFDTPKEMVFYGFFTGSILSFLVYHIFFNENEFEGPSKFSNFR